jgi:hypothetical protein
MCAGAELRHELCAGGDVSAGADCVIDAVLERPLFKTLAGTQTPTRSCDGKY